MKRIAFKSNGLLLNYLKNSGSFDVTFCEDLVKPGFRKHFKHPEEPVKVWAEISENRKHADIFIELSEAESEEGFFETHQPWLFTITLDPEIETLQGQPVIDLEASSSPWPNASLRLPNDVFSEFTDSGNEVLWAVGEWCDAFFPDWEPCLILERVSGLADLILEALKGFDSGVQEFDFTHALLKPLTALEDQELVRYMQEHDISLVSEEEDEDAYTIFGSSAAIASLADLFPGLEVTLLT